MSGRLCYGHTAHIIDASKLRSSFCYACKGDWQDGDRYAYMIDRSTRRGFAIHDRPHCAQLLEELLNGNIRRINTGQRRPVVPVPSMGEMAERHPTALYA